MPSVQPSALTGSSYVAVYDPVTGVPSKVAIRDLVPFLTSPAALLHAYGHAPTPTPTAKLDVLAVGPTKQFGEIADAITWANDGATITVDDGVYYAPLHSPVNNLTIQSASGNPYRCYVDGEGGVGGGKMLKFGKGMVYVTSPLSIKGIGFRNCGGLKTPNDYSSEAGLYAESFPALGTLSVYRCSFDNCGNGVFIPQVSSTINYVETQCVFGNLAPNSQSNPTNAGPSHDRYITPNSVTIDGSYSYGCNNGHSIKSEALTLIVRNCPWIAAWGGRAMEAAYGGAATITNSTLISRSDPLPDGTAAPGNFIGYADQSAVNFSTSSAMTLDGCTVYVGRPPSVIFMPNGGSISATNSTVRYFPMTGRGTGYLSLTGTGTVTGLPLGVPAAGDPNILTAAPAPPPIPSWLFV